MQLFQFGLLGTISQDFRRILYRRRTLRTMSDIFSSPYTCLRTRPMHVASCMGRGYTVVLVDRIIPNCMSRPPRKPGSN